MMDEYKAIIASDLPEAERIVRAFALIMGYYAFNGQNAIDLARAMGDREKLVKEQIKLETFKHAGNILFAAYHQVTGRRFPDE